MNETSLNTLLKQLIAIDSVNPDHGGIGEEKIQEFVCDWFVKRGIEPNLQEVQPGRRNVYVKVGPEDVPAYLIEAHMDTVAVDGWKTGNPFQAEERNGRLYGRGSCDTKASLAVFMSLAERFAQNPKDLKRPFVFGATVDEESMQSGAFEIMKLKGALNLCGAMTGEPTESKIVTAHKGVCRFKISTDGIAAHGSTPELGESAIWKMHALLERLADLRRSLEQREVSEEMERGTLNLGRIEGGVGFNIVPDYCEVELDRRLGVKESLEEARTQLESICSEIHGAKLQICVERPALFTDEENEFPVSLKKAAELAGEPSGYSRVAYMTNGVAYAQAGLPTLVFGPGNIAQAHKVDEFIEFGQMSRSYRILETFLAGKA